MHATGDRKRRPSPSFVHRTLNALRGLFSGHSTDRVAPSDPSKPHERARALLVEDDFVNREIAKAMLESREFAVDVVTDGAAAIDAAAAHAYGIIFMDAHLPTVDGFAAAVAIRQQERERATPRVPIVLMTADSHETVAASIRSASIDDYLGKPIDGARVDALLDTWLHGWPAPGPSTDADSAPPAALDAATLEELRRLGEVRGKDLLGDVVRLFLDSAPRRLAELYAAAASDNFTAAYEAAHGLKSAAANLGATAMSTQCAMLEQVAAAKDRTQLAAAVTAIETSAEATFAALAELDTGKSHPPPLDTTDPEPVRRTTAKRIMVVDDDALFRLATRESLRAAGFDTEEAADGIEAIRVFADYQPDLILLDAVMRGIDGFETCRRLREQPGSANVPILMVTGLNDVESVERAFHAGATGFSTKPVSYPVMIQRIQFMLRAGETEAALREHKAMLLTAQRVARLGYWRWHQASGRFDVSENLCDLCGVSADTSPSDIEGFLALVHDDDRAQVGERLQAAVRDRRASTFDYRVTRTNGDVAIVQQDLELITGTTGDVLLGTVQDVTEQRRSAERIRRMAYFDTLTGLASRNHLMQHIEETIKVARRRTQEFTLLLLDLDGFKDVNDSLGHDLGDAMLVSVAQRLQSVVRDIDFVARLGGDEFCILLDDSSDAVDAADVATRCLDAINQPLDLASHSWRPQASIGLARFPDDGDSASDLLKAADSAMYAAKQSGKHRFAFYRPEMTEQTERRLAHEQNLRVAIDNSEFELHYQPQIDLHSGHIVAVEALVRWRRSENELVLPVEFISTLERIGLICRLGNWVLLAACRQAAAWADAGLPEIRMAVNISPLHLHDPTLVATVRSALAETGLPANLLEIELTESAVQSDATSLRVLRELQGLGVRISIDDFGTGYSSLGSLRNLPINTLKVDRVFVADVLDNSSDAVMLGTIIGLAHALGFNVVAEGVEQREQAAVLAGLSCDLAQGYHFSFPVQADAIPALVDRGPFFSIATRTHWAQTAAQRGASDA